MYLAREVNIRGTVYPIGTPLDDLPRSHRISIQAAGWCASYDPRSGEPADSLDSTPGDDPGITLASLGIAEKQLAILSDLGLHTVAEAVAYHHEVAPLKDITGVGAATQAKILEA